MGISLTPELEGRDRRILGAHCLAMKAKRTGLQYSKRPCLSVRLWPLNAHTINTQTQHMKPHDLKEK